MREQNWGNGVEARSEGVLTERVFGGVGNKSAHAWSDLKEGLRSWRLWTALGWQDVRQRYRRAVLGPFWITISMATLVFALGFIYAGLFRIDPQEFLPYIAGGFIVWFFFASGVNEATGGFISAEGLIKDGGRPLTMHVFRTVFRNIIIAIHNVVVMAAIYVWQPDLLNANFFLLIPGIILFTANLLWITLIVAILCTRFRDLPPIIANLLQMFFFISPVMYKPNILPPELTFVVAWNPLWYFIEVLRAPLIGQVPTAGSYAAMAIFAVVGSAVAFWFFRWTRARVPYWL